MALTFDSTKSAAKPSHKALKSDEGAMAPPSIDEVAESSARRAGERMKKNEQEHSIFTK